MSANDACCACGGGTYEIPDSLTDPVTVRNTDNLGDEDYSCNEDIWEELERLPEDMTGCMDLYFLDANGDSCEHYDWHASSCGLHDTMTMSANDACCACGGGTYEFPDGVWGIYDLDMDELYYYGYWYFEEDSDSPMEPSDWADSAYEIRDSQADYDRVIAAADPEEEFWSIEAEYAHNYYEYVEGTVGARRHWAWDALDIRGLREDYDRVENAEDPEAEYNTILSES